jgi:hypothetical protein
MPANTTSTAQVHSYQLPIITDGLVERLQEHQHQPVTAVVVCDR